MTTHPTPADIAAIAAKLTPYWRKRLMILTEYPVHPTDIDMNGMTAKALVVRGLACRVACTTTGTDESFNGYGLTPLGIAVKAHLQQEGRS